jgi:hypothetical protein
MDLIGLAFVLPFLIGAIMAHFGANFSVDHYETGDKE